MVGDLVIATPTYNSAEYLEVFLKSYVRYAANYPLVLVIDGSSDNTLEVIDNFGIENLYVESFDSNMGQPISYNTCMKKARDFFKAKYVLMLNDDMVFGPHWERSINSYKSKIDEGFLLSLYYAWPGPYGYGAVSYQEGGKDPRNFDMDKWDSFCSSYVHPEDFVGKVGFGPGFPFIIATSMIDRYHFDEKFHTGGVLDTDFLFTLFLDGFPMERLAQNLFFHFSGGATDKQKAMGIWIEHGSTFQDKWGVSVEAAQWAITGIKGFTEEELVRLRELQNKYRYDKCG
jgi:glycosyltransferase involved in cell wall biosynthesis